MPRPPEPAAPPPASTTAAAASEEPDGSVLPGYLWELGKWTACVALIAPVLLVTLTIPRVGRKLTRNSLALIWNHTMAAPPSARVLRLIVLDELSIRR